MKMMAKKPDQRYQSAAEVAKVLAQWLARHGQTVEPGSGRGLSSGRLVGAAAGEVAGRAGGLPPLPQAGQGPAAAATRLGRCGPSGGHAPASTASPLSSADTASDLSRPTGEGSGRQPMRSASGGSDSRIRPRSDCSRPSRWTSIPRCSSSPMTTCRRRFAKQRGVVAGRRSWRPTSLRRKTAPKWLWAVAVGGAILRCC